MKIINLTQHATTKQQIASGVVEPEEKWFVQQLLTFKQLPEDYEEIEARAKDLASYAHGNGFKKAMIGGAPFLMAPLERYLKRLGITPVYAFSKREAVEKTMPDGSVVKTQVFKHLGFIEVP